MDDRTLLAACRPGVVADDMLAAAMDRGTAEEYADAESGSEGSGTHFARIYSNRARHLADDGSLLVDRDRTLVDLEALTQLDPVRLVVRMESGVGERIVYTAFLTGEPPKIQACFVHQLPDR